MGNNLDINKASIGYDKSQLDKTYENLKASCITETKNIMQKNTSEIYEYVDLAWVGTSAIQFKTNWLADVEYVRTKLDEVANVLRSTFDQIVKTMNEQENEIVQRRAGGRS